jgi:hypothetical protein
VWPIAAFCQLAPPDVQVRPMGEGAYELTLRTTRAPDVAAAQAELMPTAQTLCGADPAQLGRYSFERLEPLTGAKGPVELKLRQEVHCGQRTPEALAPPPVVIDAAEKAALVDRLHALTSQFFELQDHGRFEQAYAMLTPGLMAISAADAWVAARKDFRARAGRLLDLQIKKVTWYDNPPDAPEPGVYVAFDFSGRTERFPVYCGYLMWQQQTGGDFLLARDESAHLDEAALARISPSDLPTARANLGCRD